MNASSPTPICSAAFLSRTSSAWRISRRRCWRSNLHLPPRSRACLKRLYANIMQKGQENTGVKRRLFDWAIRVARDAVRWRAYGEHASRGLRLSWGIADRMVYSKIREGVGGRMRAFISGGGPLSRELAEFFWAVGVPVYQGYGLTETSPVVSANYPGANKVGTVGQPIAHVSVRIAEDGEIFVHGPCVMKGYYEKPEETRAVISAGWLARDRRHRTPG